MAKEDDLGPRLLDLLRGGSGHFSACDQLVREPRFALRLLPLVQRALAAHAPTEEEALLLSCQLLQRGCRRCPLEECPDASSVHEALRVACTLGKTAVATQLALGAAVLVLRSPAWEPDRLLEGIGAALLPSDSAGADAPGGRTALVLALTLLAEVDSATRTRLHTSKLSASWRVSNTSCSNRATGTGAACSGRQDQRAARSYGCGASGAPTQRRDAARHAARLVRP